MRKSYPLIKGVVLLLGFAMLPGVIPAQATMKEMKTYKEAFPEARLKCIDCHTAAIPKKEEGLDGLNDYGKAVVAEAQKEAASKDAVMPTATAYKNVGKIEDFKTSK